MTDHGEAGQHGDVALPIHPRPQLVRPSWVELAGPWDFTYGDPVLPSGGSAAAPPDHWELKIIVPFPPESPASGVGDTSYHPVVWYRRFVTRSEILRAGRGTQGTRLLLHFGAVDYHADVWVGGQYVGSHDGGHTPFAFEVTEQMSDGAEGFEVVVRAHDDPLDAGQPRGKQDWEAEPHGIWYHRTTGIWQPVWLGAVPDCFVTDIAWASDIAAGTVTLDVELDARPADPVAVTVSLYCEGIALARITSRMTEPRQRFVISLAAHANGQAFESLLWSPERPTLIEAEITINGSLEGADGVASYLGIRSANWRHGHFMLNDRPYYVRGVLEQGYWPESHLASPSAEALRAEVQLAKDLGFNTVRLHQKVEDPRYLYWADRLGLLVWGENASAYEFSTTAIDRTCREWLSVLRRDSSHPSIVAWVPLNESWGVQHISHDPAQRDYATALYHLTRAVDPSRPVVSNDGWEHTDSDIWTIHDYGAAQDLAANYASEDTVRGLLGALGPVGRVLQLLDLPDRGQPVIVSEFGGISYAPEHDVEAWGYRTTTDPKEFASILREQFTALQSSPVLAGFCYTQLTDTRQEANGLADQFRIPKLDLETLRAIVEGRDVDISAHRRPRMPSELTADSRGNDGAATSTTD